MKDFYQIDEIGKMEYLNSLCCFCSSKGFNIDNYEIFIGIDSTDKKEAIKLHPYIFSILKKISDFDKVAKIKLKDLHNPIEKELKEITVNHINFQTNEDFDLLYNLPIDSPIEYLSIKFSKKGDIIDSGGGNY